jgi:hypothetical protein
MKKLGILASAVAMTASSLFGDIAVGKGLSVSGYLDLVYTSVSNDLTSGAAGTDTSGFNATTAEIDFAFDFGNGLSATVDLEGNVGNNDLGNGAGGAELNIEQARIDYAFGDSSITLGKFDTPIGLEALESPDLYQYSVSLTTDLQYTQHTGIMYGFDNGMFNVNVGIVNSISDDNANVGNSGDELSYFGKVGVTPTDSLSFNVAYSAGDEDNTAGAGGGTPDEFTQFSVDASWSDFGWTVGAEYVDREVETGAVKTDTDGFMIMANYMFTEQFGLTARYSTSEIDGTSESIEYTIAPSYAITPNWFVLAEYRVDETDNAAGTTTDEADTIAIETILTF